MPPAACSVRSFSLTTCWARRYRCRLSLCGSGRLLCRSCGGCLAFGPDNGQHGADLDRFAFLMSYFQQNALTRARDLGIDLVRRDLEDRLVFFDLVAYGFEPFRHGPLGDGFAHLRHYDFNTHMISPSEKDCVIKIVSID